MSIKELLKSLQIKPVDSKLENNFDTWSRIGSGDSFEELKETTIEDWIKDNPYNNI